MTKKCLSSSKDLYLGAKTVSLTDAFLLERVVVDELQPLPPACHYLRRQGGGPEERRPARLRPRAVR